MKARIHAFFWILVLFVSGCIPTAKVKKGKEDLGYLETQSTLPVYFVYPKTKVARNETESEHVKELNEVEEGVGNEWYAAWQKQKEEHYEPIFIEAMNKALKEVPIKVVRVTEKALKNGNVGEKLNTIPGYYGVVEVTAMKSGRIKGNREAGTDVTTQLAIRHKKSEEMRTLLKTFWYKTKGKGGGLEEGFRKNGGGHGKYIAKEFSS
ncbi:MAG: hypothetical protein ABEH38_00240 [Flavobacteriales bacterium]